jgi:uncharacterized protein YndB with AHSA1/START domain
MRSVFWIAGCLAAIVALVAIVGALLPRDHVSTRAASYHQPPEAIWRAITNYEEFPKWRTGVTRVERLPDINGHLAWMERSGSGGNPGGIPYEMVEGAPPQNGAPGKLVTRIADPKLPFGGTWTYEVTSVSGGTELRITERGAVYNPFFRFISTLIIGQTKTINDYLTALGKKFGENVTTRN